MSTADTGLRLSPHEALARDLIMERVAARHRAHGRRHPSRTAVLLRSLADRLDKSDHADQADRPHEVALRQHAGPADEVAHAAHPAHFGQPRPWAPASRRAPHRHSV